MTQSQPPPQRPWTPLGMFASRFDANIQALKTREPLLAADLERYQPANVWFIQTSQNNILLGRQFGPTIESLPQTMHPSRAMQIADQLYPTGKYNQSLLMAGEDLGWLINRIYQLPNQSFQSHQLPLFVVMPDLERFRVMLHIQDWRTLLADPRVRLFIGAGALERFRASLLDDVMTTWPTASVIADPAILPAGESAENILKVATEALQKKKTTLAEQAHAIAANRSAAFFLEKLTSREPLKIMGICTRHSVFVRYSMIDWLAAFERLGHRTHLVIESADHQLVSDTAVQQALVDFKPDLVLMINHYRKEMAVVPPQIPFVMWAQDWCDNIITRSAGTAQGPMDFVLGHNPIRMKRAFSYPLARYMHATVAVNERRFAPRILSADQIAKYECDISFVSNASTPAQTLLDEEIRRIGSPEFARALTAIYNDLDAVYRDGGSITQIHAIGAMIDRALQSSGIELSPQQNSAVVDFFSHNINSALFRHQSLHWLAQMGVDLRLYGRGWDKHPQLARYARGVADNHNELAIVYRASKINLQISPHGVMHQRVFEGLCAGGFFLFRHCDGDTVGRHYKAVWDWCASANITTDAQLLELAPQSVKDHLTEIARLLQRDLFARPRASLIEFLKYQAANAYLDSVDIMWQGDREAVTYNSAEELTNKVQYFLANPSRRLQITESMRQPVLNRYTYLATVSRLVRFITNELTRQTQTPAKAAA